VLVRLSLFPIIFYLCLFAPQQVRADRETVAPVEIRITARRYKFEPKIITVRKGVPVRLVITSKDVEHGFAIGELNIDETIGEKETKVIEFMPNKAGRFKIKCSIYCGDGHSDMTGTLIVTESQATQSSNIQVTFDESEPGVVVVESGGEKIRIDTSKKTVAQIDEPPGTELPVSEEPTVATVEVEEKVPKEPYDYRLINVPTPKRVAPGSLNLYFTHRFSQPVLPLRESGEDLLGFDSFSVSSFGLFYGITDKLYVSAYRSPVCQRGLCKTIEIGVGYHWLDEVGRSPVALSTYASIEGDDNFTEHYTYNLQAMLARSVTRYVNLFFSPALSINANGQRRFNPRPANFFPPEPLASSFELDKHTVSFGFGVNARIRPSVSLLFEYTPRVGFKLGQVVPIRDRVTNQITGFKNNSEAAIGFGVEKDIGRHTFSLTFSNTQTTTTSRYNSSNLILPPKKFMIGFNLYRRIL
jgi:cytochrome c oxidase subunit 2